MKPNKVLQDLLILITLIKSLGLTFQALPGRVLKSKVRVSVMIPSAV